MIPRGEAASKTIHRDFDFGIAQGGDPGCSSELGTLLAILYFGLGAFVPSRACKQWTILYRAIDKQGKILDFMLSEHRDEASDPAFL